MRLFLFSCVLLKMDGSLHGLRDEVMALDSNTQPSSNKETWVVTYQLKILSDIGESTQKITAEMKHKGNEARSSAECV